MGNMLVYGGMEDYTLNHPIYIISPTNEITTYTTTAANAVNDICSLCKRCHVETIHLYGGPITTKELQHQIMSNSLFYDFSNINFIFN